MREVIETIRLKRSNFDYRFEFQYSMLILTRLFEITRYMQKLCIYKRKVYKFYFVRFL